MNMFYGLASYADEGGYEAGGNPVHAAEQLDSESFSQDEAATVAEQVYGEDPGHLDEFDLFTAEALEIEQAGTVYVTIENGTYLVADGAPWEGTLLDQYPVDIHAGATMMDAVETALAENNIAAEGVAAGYISNIHGLAAFDGGPMSGWMGTLNDWFTNAGFSATSIEDGDIISILYTTNGYGEDLGGSFYNQDTSLKSLFFDSGELSPQFSGEQSTYTLHIHEGITEIVVTPTAANKNYQVRVYLDAYDASSSGYKRTEAIPVAEGSQIIIGVGDPLWPSMNSSSGATLYTVAISYPEEEGDPQAAAPKEQLNKNLAYLVQTVRNPTFGTGGGEWSILSLARANYPVPEGYYDLYYENVEKAVKQLMVNPSHPGKLDRNKGSEHSRLMLGLVAIGKDVSNVAGYDIKEALADYQFVIRQGINGPIFALIALDSQNFDVPVLEGVAEQTTREKLIQYILDREVNKGGANAGGWALWGSVPDPDITSMAIQGLTPYYETDGEVRAAIDRAVAWLSSAQLEDGGYGAWGSQSSESVAQVIVALTGLKIDPHKDPRFRKNGRSALDALMEFAVPEGGFKHVKSGSVDGMATDQGTYALVAYDRFVEGKNRLYDMTDVPSEPEEKDETAPTILIHGIEDGQVFSRNEVLFTVSVTDNVDPVIQPTVMLNGEILTGTDGSYYAVLLVGTNTIRVEATDAAGNKSDVTYTLIYHVQVGQPEELPLPAGDKPVLEVPADSRDVNIPVAAGDSGKDITIKIPAAHRSKVTVDLPKNSSLPGIKVEKGDVAAEIPKGAAITSGDPAALELLTFKHANAAVTDKLSQSLPSDQKLDEIVQIISLGGDERIQFDRYVTITFLGAKGKSAAYMENGTLRLIEKFASDADGERSGKAEYAYDSGNHLIVKTKHFTDFIVYSASAQSPSGGGPDDGSGDDPDDGSAGGPGGGTGGGVIPPSQAYVTLSIDKLTIQKGYVLNPTRVEFHIGESVWDVLKREMDRRGIAYEFEYFAQYDSVYVQSIEGDGEFDHGSESGWMYNVNGVYPSYGASKYKLKDGDVVQWRYTTNLGEDLGEDNSKWEEPKNPGFPGMYGGAAAGGQHPVIEVPENISEDYVVSLTNNLKSADSITIKLPKQRSAKVLLDLEVLKDSLPNLKVQEESKLLVIDKGTKLASESAKIEVFTQLDQQDEALTSAVNAIVSEQKGRFVDAFVMGNSEEAVFFDNLITLTLNGKAGLQAGYLENHVFVPIPLYSSEDRGRQATRDREKQVFAYVSGNDLILRTNFLTTFVLYATDASDSGNIQLEDVYEDAGLISAWAYEAVKEATQLRFVEGSNSKINPKANVTRAEFTKMLVSVFGYELDGDQTVSFADVQENDWFYPYIQAAYREGLASGYDQAFYPHREISREEMAAMIQRALKLESGGGQEEIADLHEVSSWAQSVVQTVVEAEMMRVDADRKFTPKVKATREMAIVVALRAYHYEGGQRTSQEKPRDDGKNEAAGTKSGIQEAVQQQIEKTAAFMQETIPAPGVGSIGGEWTVLGLARSGEPIPSEYYERYYSNVELTLTEKSGQLHRVKYTEYDRVILALTALGKDITNVAGYDLREPLADFNTLTIQGINGPIFALLALDSRNYEIPEVEGVAVQTTRERLIAFILAREITGGGWALGQNPEEADADITAMAIQALTPYYPTNQDVKAAVDRGLQWLSKTQHGDGAYASWGSVNSESTAQVIVALTGLNIDPHTDARFVKNGRSAIDALMSFAVDSGGFYHVKPGEIGNGGAEPGVVDPMATDQAMYALVAYNRFVQGENRLYEMTDVE
ncbi:DUF4430 domain-containing protein [Xylanibacillus composti]|nr:DUF4430 domain-containing protein [Xylanibacillus composti]